jgi:hypothetical protein
MLAEGNYCDLFIYDGVGHLFTPSHLNDKGVPIPDKTIQAEAYSQADKFLLQLGYIEKQ